MLGSLIQLATQGIETQLHINPTIVSYRIVSRLGLSGYEVDLELPVVSSFRHCIDNRRPKAELIWNSISYQCRIVSLPKHWTAWGTAYERFPRNRVQMPKADISTSYNLNIIILLSSYPFISLIFTIKSHLQSYPYPNNINTSWNIGFLLGLSIVLQLITGILLSLHYTPHINYSYYSIMYIISEFTYITGGFYYYYVWLYS